MRSFIPLKRRHKALATLPLTAAVSAAISATATLMPSVAMAQLEEDLSHYRKADAEELPRELLWEIDRIHMRNRLPIFASTKTRADDLEGAFAFGEVDEVIP